MSKPTELSALIALRGLTVNEIAARANINRSHLSRLLNGRVRINPQTHRRIERAIFSDLVQEAPDDSPAD